MYISITEIFHELIQLVGDAFVKTGILKPDILHSLYLIMGPHLLSAFDLIDRDNVSSKLLLVPSLRRIPEIHDISRLLRCSSVVAENLTTTS